MLLIAIAALWAGGWFFGTLVILVSLGVLWEWIRLVRGFVPGIAGRLGWYIAGLIYVGGACLALLYAGGVIEPMPQPGLPPVLGIIGGVIGTDVGAYFAGRTFGGPKIAPKISPSKTWSGLIGGIFGASVVLTMIPIVAIYWIMGSFGNWIDLSALAAQLPINLAIGALVAVTAQAGDFFESWMKRRAGVKDSSNLIPGHGGLFDRTDGLLAVSFLVGLLLLVAP